MKKLVLTATALILAFAAAPAAHADEIDDAVQMFTADDGLTAAEKLPALKALIEAHKGNPNVGKLTAVLKDLAAEAGEPVADGRDKRDPPAVKPAVVAGDPPATAETGEADAAPEVEMPPVKISTPEEIEAGFAALPPLPAVRDLGAFKTVKPILPDDFLNSVSRKSVIANVREIMRELQGPLSDADTKRFDERWEAVIDYPSDEILEWLKKASPLLSELMMLKAALSDNVMSYNEALAEANFARDYGDYESARAAVMQIGEVAATMKSIQTRMDQIGASLDELGEMPDPAEQKKSAAAAHKAARKAVRDMFRDESEIDGEYEATGPYLYCMWKLGKDGKPEERWSLEKGAIGGATCSMFGANKLFIRKVVEHDKTGVTGLYVYDYGKSGGQGSILQAKHDGKGGYIVYSGIFGEFFKNQSGERVTLKMEFDDNNNEILVIRGHHVASVGNSSAWTLQMRPTGVSYTCMPGADTTQDSPEEVAAIFTEEKFGKVWGEMWDGAEKNYAEVYKKIKPPRDEIPFASTVHYVLRGMEPFDTNHPMPPEKRDILKAPEFYEKLADSMVPKDPKKNEPRPQAQAAVLHVGGAGGFTFGKKTTCDIFFINPKNGRKVTMDTAESDVQARWGIPTPVFRAADGKCTIDVWTDIKRCEGSQHRGKYPLEDWLEFTLHAPNAAGDNSITKKCGDGSLKTSSTIVPLLPRTLPDRISLELGFLAFQGYAGKGVRFIYERAMMDAHDAELTARETMADFETAMKKELDADVFGKIFKAVKENSDKQLAGAEEALTADMTDEMANDPNRMKAEEIQQFQELAKAAEDEAARLEKEIAAEKDPKRKETLNFLLVCKQSDRIEALARADAVATGEWHAPRTPFDDMCHVQMMESAMRELAESEELSHVRDGWARMMAHLSQADRDRAEMILENHIKDDRLNPKLWREVIYKLHDQDVNETTGRIHMLTDKELAAEDMIKRFERAKFWCDLGMAAAGIGGASRVWAYAYSMGWGYIENGPMGIAKGAITTSSSLIDVVWSGYDGYKNGGAWGAIQAAGWSGFLNYGLPKVLEKVPWHADITPRFGQKPTYKSADVVRMEIETRRATKDISDYTVKKNRINELEFKPETPGSTKMVLKRPNGKIVTDAELKVMRKAVVQATAKINANPTAKAILKYSKGYKKIGADYDMELGRIHNAVKAQYYKSMEAKGFNSQQIESIRNASSKGTVGMDADWGLVEGKPITRYGRPCSKYEYMTEGQKSWNTDYKKTTGFSAEDSWENLTTSIHPEAYRNRAALSMSESGIKTRNLIRNMSPADAKQMMDVSRYKADSMMNSKRFPRLVRVREASRGAAKDMGGKMLPAIKSRIDSLKRLEGMAGKHGKALSKSQAHDLKRLEAAYDRYSRIHSKLDKIGKGELPPEDWDDTIKTATGGLTISEMLGELGDIFVSLSRK